MSVAIADAYPIPFSHTFLAVNCPLQQKINHVQSFIDRDMTEQRVGGWVRGTKSSNG